MNIVKITSCDAIKTIKNFISNKKHGFAYCVHDKKSIFISRPDAVDRVLCTELGYDVLETMHTGGVVVVSEGDLSVVHFGQIGNTVIHNFAMYLVEQYKERGLNATFDGNDVLIDGYKISGLSATPYSGIQYSTIHIGVNTNLEHIKTICTKPMAKVPKGLSEYDITVTEVEGWLLDFLENYEEI